MKTYAKFAVLVVAIIGVLALLATSGINESKTYYKTISELNKMGHRATVQRVRVGGDVEEGSILRDGRAVSFVLHQDALKLKVVYSGMDPLPDTFKGERRHSPTANWGRTARLKQQRYRPNAPPNTKPSRYKTKKPCSTRRGLREQRPHDQRRTTNARNNLPWKI